MLLNKIHHLKMKIKNTIDNLDLLNVLIEDNDVLHNKIEKQEDEILSLKSKIKKLESLNLSYSNDIVLLSRAISEQYEVLKDIVDYMNFGYVLRDEEEDEVKKKKKKIVH